MATKGAIGSKTNQGITFIVAVVTTFLAYGPEIQALFPPDTFWFKLVQGLLVAAGAGWAFYGRYTASMPIKGLTTEKNQGGKANPALLAVCAVILATLLLSGCATVCNEKNVKDGLTAANQTFAVVSNATADAIETGALDGAAEEKVLKVLAIAHDALTSAERFEALGMVEEACSSIGAATGAIQKAVK
jgi:hypothetical protein